MRALEDSQDDKRVIMGSALFDVLAILSIIFGIIIGISFLFETGDCRYNCTFDEKRPLFAEGWGVIVGSILQAVLFRAAAAYLRAKISFQNRQLATLNEIHKILMRKENIN